MHIYIDTVEKSIRGAIYKISYDYLTIMPKLRSTYDGRLIYQTSYNEWKAFQVRFTSKIVISSEIGLVFVN